MKNFRTVMEGKYDVIFWFPIKLRKRKLHTTLKDEKLEKKIIFLTKIFKNYNQVTEIFKLF